MNDMKKWRKISDYLFFQEGPGVRNHQYTSIGIKLLNVANLVNGRVDLTTSERYISNEEAYGKYKHFLADEGDLIIASSGIKVDYFDKKMGFIRKEHLPICMNTSTIRLKSLDKSKLDINYFMYYLKSQSFKDQLSKQITGSAQLNFGPSHLKKMEFPIVDIEEQSSINSVLGNIQNQIRLKEEQLLDYDQLIKSRFVGMFGTLENTIYKVESLMNISDLITDGTHQTPTYTDDKNNGYKFLSSKDVTSGKIDWTNIKYIPEELHKELYKRITPMRNDILLAKNGTTGTAALVDVDDVFDIYVSLALIKLKKDMVNPIYSLHAINSIDTKRQFNASLKGVGVPNLHLGEIRKAKIIVPPIDLQNQFVQLTKQVDKLKFVVQKSLDETQKLFDSLMQEYFG